MSSTYKLVCPHCYSKAYIRTSEGKHIFLRICYVQCSNESCGWSGRAEFMITHELSPSGDPNPTVKLPVAPVAMRRQCIQSRQVKDKTETQLDWIQQEPKE